MENFLNLSDFYEEDVELSELMDVDDIGYDDDEEELVLDED